MRSAARWAGECPFPKGFTPSLRSSSALRTRCATISRSVDPSSSDMVQASYPGDPSRKIGRERSPRPGDGQRRRRSGRPVNAVVDLGEDVVLPLDVAEPARVDLVPADLVVQPVEAQEVLLRAPDGVLH